MRKFVMISAMLMIMLMAAACSSADKKDVEVKSTLSENEVEKSIEIQEEEGPTYQIVENAFRKENAEIPKIYIDTTEEVGRDDYVTASVRVEDNSGQFEEISDVNAKIKLRGHTTATGDKAPYNIKFMEKKNILGMGSSKKWCLIANLFDSTQMRNRLALDLARNMGLSYTSKCEYVELYYRGEDQGMYLLCTPVSEGKDKVDINISENDYLLQLQPYPEYSNKPKITTGAGIIFSIEEGNAEDLTYLNDFMKKFEEAISYGMDSLEEYADIDSFVDFYVFNEIVKDVDFATSSTYFYIKEGKIYAGPAWDYDLSMGNVDSEYHPEYNNVNTGEENYKGLYCQKFWYYYIMQIPEFQDKVKKRFNELQPLIENLTTDNDLGKNRIDVILNQYGTDIEHNFTLWEVGKKYGIHSMAPMGTYEENVEYLRQWLKNRNEWLKGQWAVSDNK